MSFCSLFMFVLAPIAARAYDMDVHFNLTYVMSRLAGLSDVDAKWIAAADESMDENETTSAFLGIGNTFMQEIHLKPKVWVRNGELYHAFTHAGAHTGFFNDGLHTIVYDNVQRAREASVTRRDELWNRVQRARQAMHPHDRALAVQADIAFGQFLHFEQDYYAHRQLSAYLDGQSWRPYGPVRGHSADGHLPDYVALRVDLALEMADASYPYFVSFARGNPPIPASEPDRALLEQFIRADASVYPAAALRSPFGLAKYSDQQPVQSDVVRAMQHAAQESPQTAAWANEIPKYSKASFTIPFDAWKTPIAQLAQHLSDAELASSIEKQPKKACLEDVLTNEFRSESAIPPVPRVHCLFCQ